MHEWVIQTAAENVLVDAGQFGAEFSRKLSLLKICDEVFLCNGVHGKCSRFSGGLSEGPTKRNVVLNFTPQHC